MADFGDLVLSAQERHLKRSLERRGIKPREIEIPAPHYHRPEGTTKDTGSDDDHSA